METNPCDTNQLDCDSHLPPRKRLLNGFKKLNSNGNGSSSPSPFASSSSTSNSNGSSSSASTDVQTHLDNLLSSRFNNNNDRDLSPEELVEASRSAAALAVKAAKAARAIANEKALISAKAIAAAKRALELVDSFPKEAFGPDCSKERSPRKNKQKKHVPVEVLYSKGRVRDEDEELAIRLHRGVDNKYPRVLKTSSVFEENGHRNKKQKRNYKNVVEGGSSSIVNGTMNEIVAVVNSESSEAIKALKPDEADLKEKAEEESNLLAKRRGRVKLKKLPLSICNSRDQENGTSSSAVSPLPVVRPPPEEEDGVIPAVIPGSSSSTWKCQDLKAPECVKQNKAVQS